MPICFSHGTFSNLKGRGGGGGGIKNSTLVNRYILIELLTTEILYKHIYTFIYTVGASSQCYWDVLILLKCELMLLECQINTNTDKNGFLLSIKCIEVLILSFNYFKKNNVCQFYNHFVLIWHSNSISSFQYPWEDAFSACVAHENLIIFFLYIMRFVHIIWKIK